ncbi:ABC transporter substrate-binding protein [Bradyrhizobium sp.]|uniref:ABC transporter substrate-binding protein n=1 Tax=Bradyrhizobium sp. TaxID=376 RepID=UPI003C6F057E
MGLIGAFSGPFASLGEGFDRGARLYEKIHANDLPAGVTVEVIRRDDAGSPDNTRRIAQELIVREHIKLIAGVALSPQGFALAKLATEAKIPVVLMNATTSSLTRSSPYFVRFSYTQWHTAYSIGVWAGKSGIKTADSLVADYAAGVDSEAAFRKGFEENGGKLVNAVRAPMITTDYLPFMERIKADKPDAVFTFVNGGRMASVSKSFIDTGLKAAGARLIGPGDVALDDEVRNLPPDIAGVITAASYTVGNQNPGNVAFVKAWKAEYGEDSTPNVTAVSGWDAMSAIYGTAKELGDGADSEAILKSLSNWKGTDSPRGDVSIDPATRDIVLPIQINKVEIVDGKPTNVTMESLPPLKDPWKTFNP